MLLNLLRGRSYFQLSKALRWVVLHEGHTATVPTLQVAQSEWSWLTMFLTVRGLSDRTWKSEPGTVMCLSLCVCPQFVEVCHDSSKSWEMCTNDAMKVKLSWFGIKTVNLCFKLSFLGIVCVSDGDTWCSNNRWWPTCLDTGQLAVSAWTWIIVLQHLHGSKETRAELGSIQTQQWQEEEKESYRCHLTLEWL